MKRRISKIDEHRDLFRESETGIAWIEDRTTGLNISVHANISDTGSVAGMKNLGRWSRNARTVRSHGFIYNIDTFICDINNELERIVANACKCAACTGRVMEIGGFVKNLKTGEYDLMFCSEIGSEQLIRDRAIEKATAKNVFAGKKIYDIDDITIMRRFKRVEIGKWG